MRGDERVPTVLGALNDSLHERDKPREEQIGERLPYLGMFADSRPLAPASGRFDYLYICSATISEPMHVCPVRDHDDNAQGAR